MPTKSLPQAKAGVGIHAFSPTCQIRGQWALGRHDGKKRIRVGQTFRGLVSDGVLQLVYGEHDHPVDCSNFEFVGPEHLTERQEDLRNIRDLRTGWLAEQTPEGCTFAAQDDRSVAGP